MHLPSLLSSLAFGALTAAIPAANSNGKIPIRAPPTISPSHNWQRPPKNFISGSWWVSYTSNPHLTLYNFKWQRQPASHGFPYINTVQNLTYKSHYTPLADISSYNIAPNSSLSDAANNKLYTIFGYDFFPTDEYNVYDFHTTGRANVVPWNTAEVISWGCDGDGGDYLVVYESAIPPNFEVGIPGQESGLDILSKRKGGPDEGTMGKIVEGVKGLGIDELTNIVGHLYKMQTDNRRDGEGEVKCGDACMSNSGTPS